MYFDSIYSDAALSGFSYCGENGLNFSTNSANYSEDDADFAPGRRNKPSRVSIKLIKKIQPTNHSLSNQFIIDNIEKLMGIPLFRFSFFVCFFFVFK